MQLAYMAITIAIGGCGGALTGLLVKRPFFDPVHESALFLDEVC